MTFDLDQAKDLAAAVERTGLVFAVTHNYTGYPLVRQARSMILAGELGEIQAIRSNYIQGWLRTKLEESDQKQAAWRTDPKRSGAAGCFGDIATHAYNLARYMTGLRPTAISAHLRIFEPGRKLDDYGTALIKFENGGLGNVTASQISHGRENDLFIEIDGTQGALQWRQENPNRFVLRCNGQPHRVYTRDRTRPFTTRRPRRLPPAQRTPEAFRGFANIYTAAFDAMIAHGQARRSKPGYDLSTYTTASKACCSYSKPWPAVSKTESGAAELRARATLEMPRYQRVVIVGVGLLGGSIGLALAPSPTGGAHRRRRQTGPVADRSSSAGSHQRVVRRPAQRLRGR